MSAEMTAALRGRDMRVFVKDDEDAFILLAGLQTKALSFKSKVVDVTHLNSPNAWRELLGGAGVKFADIRGRGLFTNAAASALARTLFFAQDIRDYQFMLPELGVFEGAFLLTELTYTGTYDGEAVYELALESAGPPSFTPIS